MIAICSHKTLTFVCTQFKHFDTAQFDRRAQLGIIRLSGRDAFHCVRMCVMCNACAEHATPPYFDVLLCSKCLYVRDRFTVGPPPRLERALDFLWM